MEKQEIIILDSGIGDEIGLSALCCHGAFIPYFPHKKKPLFPIYANRWNS